MRHLDRRQALALLASFAVVWPRAEVSAASQTRTTARDRVVLGPGHGLLLSAGGTVHIWHKGRQGERLDAVVGLGPTTVLAPFTLAELPGLTGVVAAAAGNNCSFVVRADGTLLAWGINAGSGKLGTTPLATVETLASWGPDANTPVPLAVRFDAIDVAAHGDHVLALTRDGHVYAWGTGVKGQLGIGPMPVVRFRTRSPSAMTYVPFPTQIPDLSEVAAISTGPAHSLALLGDGTVRAWGDNRWGQVGDGTTVNRNAPVPVAGVRRAVAVVAGGSGSSAALLNDGTIMTWGNRVSGWLGRAPTTDNVADPTPAPVPGGRGIRAIAAGRVHMLALTETGTIMSWGDSTFGAIGRGANVSPAPAQITSLTGVQSIAAFDITSFAVLANGRIMTFGGVRPWTRPPEEGSYDDLSRSPILLWLDGLEQP